jgi:ATP-dependent RNA helicase RhlB
MAEKAPLLVQLLRRYEAHRTMVFVNMRRTAERLEGALRANGVNAQALSGDVPQNKRLRFLREFHEGKLAVLIATDVASRGLHIPDVSHIFNFDLPQDPADYVHRIGRTARAGADGDAISFGCEDYAISLPDIEGYIGHKIPVESYDHTTLPVLEAAPYDASRHGHGGPPRGGRRGSPGGPRPGNSRSGGRGAPRRHG